MKWWKQITLNTSRASKIPSLLLVAPLSSTMADQSRVWSYFIKGSQRFRSNKSNWEAWCRSCVNKKARATHRAQLNDTERTEEVDAVEDLEAHCEWYWWLYKSEIPTNWNLVCTSETALCGKVDDMWLHLASRCEEVSPLLKADAQCEVDLWLTRTKANKENTSPITPSQPSTSTITPQLTNSNLSPLSFKILL